MVVVVSDVVGVALPVAAMVVSVALGFTVVVVVIRTFFEDFQTSFPRTLEQTNGAFFVPESSPTFLHFCPALAAETEEDGKPRNNNEALRPMVNKHLVRIATDYSDQLR